MNGLETSDVADLICVGNDLIVNIKKILRLTIKNRCCKLTVGKWLTIQLAALKILHEGLIDRLPEKRIFTCIILLEENQQ
ncbi:MAG: hypothetical protein LUI10_14155 [Lachnospiraceae bacterium]|nr:hypothetical protein [Lachnospiraceae bacterium]